MDPRKITEKLRDLVIEYVGVTVELTSNPGLVGTNTKHIGRVAGLLPSEPLAQAWANSWIHQISSVIPYLSTPQGVETLLSTLESLLPLQPVFALPEFGIVDLLVASIASTTEVFNSFPVKFRKLRKYLKSLESHKTVGKYIPKAEAAASRRNFEVVYGTGGRYRIDYVLRTPELVDKVITVKGWAKTGRIQGGGEFAFIELNDGSSVNNLQIVVGKNIPNFEKIKGTGFSVSCKGLLIESPGEKQAVEMQISDPALHSLDVYGDCDQGTYPLTKKNHTLEFLRDQAHLRPRTNLIGCVARVRNALAFATHFFFNKRGFLYIHTPIITASDCEGAGEMFQVTNLPKKIASLPKTEAGDIDFSMDFFGKAAYLTVSGQLDVENYCCALSDVYTFGPTFRAENSHTTRHLAEFWMIEPELAWCDLEGNMECAESYLKFCLQYVIDNCYDDLVFFEQRVEKGLISRLRNVLEKPFARMTYTEALEIIQKSGKTFTCMPQWGDDLQSEHERYVCEEIIKGPVIVYNYPKVLKSFYMKVNEDDKTVQAMDILVPKIGEVIGGSAREDRLEQLDKMIEYKGLDKESYWWYRQLRMYGSVPHTGFGLGFERLVMMATGIENIRDVIPYPRWPGHAEF